MTALALYKPRKGTWGVFSAAVPGRVGSQCRLYYRRLQKAGFVAGFVVKDRVISHAKVSAARCSANAVVLSKHLHKFSRIEGAYDRSGVPEKSSWKSWSFDTHFRKSSTKLSFGPSENRDLPILDGKSSLQIHGLHTSHKDKEATAENRDFGIPASTFLGVARVASVAAQGLDESVEHRQLSPDSLKTTDGTEFQDKSLPTPTSAAILSQELNGERDTQFLPKTHVSSEPVSFSGSTILFMDDKDADCSARDSFHSRHGCNANERDAYAFCLKDVEKHQAATKSVMRLEGHNRDMQTGPATLAQFPKPEDVRPHMGKDVCSAAESADVHMANQFDDLRDREGKSPTCSSTAAEFETSEQVTDSLAKPLTADTDDYMLDMAPVVSEDSKITTHALPSPLARPLDPSTSQHASLSSKRIPALSSMQRASIRYLLHDNFADDDVPTPPRKQLAQSRLQCMAQQPRSPSKELFSQSANGFIDCVKNVASPPNSRPVAELDEASVASCPKPLMRSAMPSLPVVHRDFDGSRAARMKPPRHRVSNYLAVERRVETMRKNLVTFSSSCCAAAASLGHAKERSMLLKDFDEQHNRISSSLGRVALKLPIPFFKSRLLDAARTVVALDGSPMLPSSSAPSPKGLVAEWNSLIRQFKSRVKDMGRRQSHELAAAMSVRFL